jgi:hypothetical protein
MGRPHALEFTEHSFAGRFGGFRKTKAVRATLPYAAHPSMRRFESCSGAVEVLYELANHDRFE